MLHFGVYYKGKRRKTLRAKQMNTIYRNYKKYSESRGFNNPIPHQDSFGHHAWQNTKGEVLTLVREG